jgi:hypothetical protein
MEPAADGNVSFDMSRRLADGVLERGNENRL